jgi:hypothetical protein
LEYSATDERETLTFYALRQKKKKAVSKAYLSEVYLNEDDG